MDTILIVDDDYDLRDSLTDVLEDEGFRPVTAADGIEALEFLRANPPPALILLDWMMPRCDGAQFRAQQLADPKLAAIPVVLLTADARVEDKKAAIRVEDVLPKPVKLDVLLEVIAKYRRPNAD